MERHGLQFGMRFFPPSYDDFVNQRAMSVLWEHVEGCRPLCVVTSLAHDRFLDLAVEICHNSAAEWETLCVYHTNKHFIESRQEPEGFDICSRSTHSDCCGLYARVKVRRDGAFGGSMMAVRDDSATNRHENAAKVCRR